MKLYIDEAGHTGRHLFDASQPLFFYAGVWLSEDLESTLSDRMAHLTSASGINGERKGSRLVSSSPGRRFITELLGPCIEANSPVSIVSFNKPFQAAAVVVEDCTDHVHNPAFTERWTWDTSLKEPLASQIYAEANPRQLMNAWKARRGPCSEFCEAYRSLLGALQLCRNPELSVRAQEMSRADFEDIWSTNRDVGESFGGWSYSPNLNAFIGLIQIAETQATRRGVSGVELVHDEQVEFEPLLMRAFSTFRNAGQGSFTLPNGNQFKTPIERLTSLSFSSSATSVGLQVADIVAACAKMFVSNAEGPGKQLSDVARWILNAGDQVFPFAFGSVDWQTRTYESFRRFGS